MNGLHEILKIGKEVSIRGSGISLREALARSRFVEVREELNVSDLTDLVKLHPDYVDEWIAYSEDKRTSSGWYVLKSGEIGQVSNASTKVQLGTIEQAIAEFVIRELDYWANINSPNNRMQPDAAKLRR